MQSGMTPRCAVGSGILVLCAATFAWAQDQRPTTAAENTVTVVGCLQEERNVAGRQPNIFERLGIAEDFILTEAMLEGQASKPVGTSGSAEAASADMYQVVGLDDERLRQHAGRRVEVTGRIQPEVPRAALPEVPIGEGAQTGTRPRPLPPDRGERDDRLERIHAADIRQLEGGC